MSSVATRSLSLYMLSVGCWISLRPFSNMDGEYYSHYVNLRCANLDCKERLHTKLMVILRCHFCGYLLGIPSLAHSWLENGRPISGPAGSRCSRNGSTSAGSTTGLQSALRQSSVLVSSFDDGGLHLVDHSRSLVGHVACCLVAFGRTLLTDFRCFGGFLLSMVWLAEGRHDLV
jgi:hypothetical protein